MTLVEQLRGMLVKATPGPWADYGIDHKIWSLSDHLRLATVSYHDRAQADIDLIVAAINALPKLLAVVKAAYRARDFSFELDEALDALEVDR